MHAEPERKELNVVLFVFFIYFDFKSMFNVPEGLALCWTGDH